MKGAARASELMMKTSLFSFFALMTAIFTTLAPRPTLAATDVSIDYYYDALAPYGHWIEVEGYGFCWTPDNVDADWTPYSEGNWVYTNAGWTWMGDEEFADIVYHYGRWILVEGEGWCWVPGYEWGPAWVSWRDSEDYIGWAPLPPDASWQPSVGFGVWVDDVYGIGPRYYSFCHRRDFGEHHLRRLILPRNRNMIFINESVNITNITYNNAHGVVHCGGPGFEHVNRYATHAVPMLNLVRRNDYDFNDSGRYRKPLPRGIVSGDSLQVVAPRVFATQESRNIRPKTTKVVSKEQAHKGWIGMGDAVERESVRNKIHNETRGLNPSNAPARATASSGVQISPRTGAKKGSNTITADTLRKAVPAGETHGSGFVQEQNQPPKAIPMPQIIRGDNPPVGKNRTIDGGRLMDEVKKEKTERANAESLVRQRESEFAVRNQMIERQKLLENQERQKQEISRANYEKLARQRASEESAKKFQQQQEVMRGNAEKLARQREAEESARRNAQRQQEMQKQRSSFQPQEDKSRGRQNDDDDDRKKKKR
jgi:hypothetical protein